MYEEFFQLAGPPFKLNPDPKFFFGSSSHNKAMAYLHYGLRQAEGFIVITGEIGAGKSMLIGHLLDQLDRSTVAAAHLLTPNLRPDELLGNILSAFRIEPQSDSKTALLEAFEDYLFDQMNNGRRVLLIVDEAQNLPRDTLEELRVLSNMDYDGTPLFQVFLAAQPDFRQVIAADDMEQMRQRILASYHLEPLNEAETRHYVEHRLALVGWRDDPTVDDEAFAEIYRQTDGVPRRINNLCNRIFLFCSIEEEHQVDLQMVRKVVDDLMKENAATGILPATAQADAPQTDENDNLAVSAEIEASDEEQEATDTLNTENAALDASADELESDDEGEPLSEQEALDAVFEALSDLQEAESAADDDIAAAAMEVATEAEQNAVNNGADENGEETAPADNAAMLDETVLEEAFDALSDEAVAGDVGDTGDEQVSVEPASPASEPSDAAPVISADASATTNQEIADSEVKGAAPMTDEPMSVLDRLRAKRNAAAEPAAPVESQEVEQTPDTAAPTAASMDDVAEAIAAVESDEPATDDRPERNPFDDLKDLLREDEALLSAGSVEQSSLGHPLADDETDAASDQTSEQSEDASEPSIEDAFDMEALAAELDESSEEEAAQAAPVSFDGPEWRESVKSSIDNTREELKEAHANLARIRERVTDASQRREANKAKIMANLARAEEIIAELRSAWR